MIYKFYIIYSMINLKILMDNLEFNYLITLVQSIIENEKNFILSLF